MKTAPILMLAAAVLAAPLADASAKDRIDFARRSAVAKYFGGTPRTGTDATPVAPAATLPKLALPPPTAAPAGPNSVTAPKKKKKEGC